MISKKEPVKNEGIKPVPTQVKPEPHKPENEPKSSLKPAESPKKPSPKMEPTQSKIIPAKIPKLQKPIKAPEIKKTQLIQPPADFGQPKQVTESKTPAELKAEMMKQKGGLKPIIKKPKGKTVGFSHKRPKF